MAEPVTFKGGKDCGIEVTETVICVVCGTEEADEKAYADGWQMEPAVCPNCLSWSVTAAAACGCSGTS
jgi:hypothetical protein